MVDKRAMAKKPAMDDKTRRDILERLGQTIASKRDAAIAARQACGIETIWTEDEEFYQGYDDANRHEFQEAVTKPTEGGATAKRSESSGSTLFPNITAPYVDAAAAKVADMLLPTDDRNFVIEPTPVPDILDEEEGFPEAEPEPGEQPPQQPPAQPGQPGEQPPSREHPMVIAAAIMLKLAAIKRKAGAAAKKLQDQVDDYFVECQYHDELRRLIDDSARIGTGVVKGPVPEKRKVKVWAKNPTTGERELVVKVETKPGSKRVDTWNCFPDFPACGENIHHGSFFLERDFFSKKRLSQLKGGVGASAYMDDQIDKVLKEGPAKSKATGRGYLQDQEYGDADVFEVWYFYGSFTGEEMTAAGCPCDDPMKEFPAILTMVNDTVIKAARNPLDDGAFPYDFLPWKRRKGMPWGSGVARQGRVAQRITTASVRAMMDNVGAAARPHKVMTDAIEQDGDPWTWRLDSESNITDVRTAMQFFVQPSLQQQYDALIARGERMMELHTGLPMIILGIQGNIEETAHGRALQNNNGSTVLRRIARNFDAMTERHVSRYDDWVKLYHDDDTLKGDFKIKARGSAALVERDLQNQMLPMVMQLSLNPAYELDPKLTAREFLKMQRFDPSNFELTEARKKELAERMKPVPPPQIAVAQIREQGATERLKMQLSFDAQDSELERQLKIRVQQIDTELATRELAEDRRQALDKHRVDLATLAMELRQQRELSPGPQVLKPPTEPAGKAPNGMAYPQ